MACRYARKGFLFEVHSLERIPRFEVKIKKNGQFIFSMLGMFITKVYEESKRYL